MAHTIRIDDAGNVTRVSDPHSYYVPGNDLFSPPSSAVKRLKEVSPVFWGLLLLFVTLCAVVSLFENKIAFMLLILTGWIIALTLHEFAHAVSAYRFGDHSVEDRGYLTLDVTKFSDPFMTFFVPTIILIVGGVPLPGGAVQLMTSSFTSRGQHTFVALAGPSADLICAGIAAAAVHILKHLPWIHPNDNIIYALSLTAYFQTFAAVLNIIPLPNLDGWHATEPWLPEECFLKKLMKNPNWSRLTALCCVGVLVLFILKGPYFGHAMRFFSNCLWLNYDEVAMGMYIFQSVFKGNDMW